MKSRLRATAFICFVLLVAIVCVHSIGASGQALVEREIHFQNGGTTVSGTLVLPRRPGVHPAVVLVQGSGPETRGEYLRSAREFAQAGVAAVAFDKRGAGKSGSGNPRAPFDTLAGDVLAAVDFLTKQPDIDAGRIGLWGLSEGEWVAPLAASKMVKPAFLILVSASSVTPALQVRTEIANRLRSKRYPDSVIARAESLYDAVSRFQRDGSARAELNAALLAASREPWLADAKYFDSQVPEYQRVLSLPWFPAWRDNMDFDALPLIEKLDCPVLVLLGGKDPKNDAHFSETRYRAALAKRANRHFHIEIFPNAAHAMVEWWLPLHLPPPHYPRGYFELQRKWLTSELGL